MALFGKKQTYSFADVLRGIQHAVNSTQEMLQVQQLSTLSKFWKPDSGEPVTQKIKAGDRELEVPLMALVPHSHLEMEEIEISFKTKIGNIAAKTESNGLEANFEQTHTDLQMELESVKATDSDVMDIKIRFKHREMPEGIARLTDEYNKQL